MSNENQRVMGRRVTQLLRSFETQHEHCFTTSASSAAIACNNISIIQAATVVYLLSWSTSAPPSSPLMQPVSYSSNTIATCAITGLVGALQLSNFIYSCRIMHAYRSKQQQKQLAATPSSSASSSPHSYPFLIRLLFLLSNICALMCIMNAFFPILMFAHMTEESTAPASSSSSSSASSPTVYHIDPWRDTSLEHFHINVRLCAVGMKLGVSFYVWTKLFSYLFFFVKQRAVRPLSSPSKLEKFTLGLTFSMVLFAILILIVTEPEPNELDGTCQLLLPIYTIVFMACADATISILYLYLFIKPLRETIVFNRRMTRKVDIGAGWNTTGATSSPRTILPHDPAATVQPLSPAATSTHNGVVHVLLVASATPATTPVFSSTTTTLHPNTALEGVMRKNTYACLVTIIISLIILSLMVWSHVTNEPYSRKWVVVGGSLDIFIACLALRYIMHKPSSSVACSSGLATTACTMKKNQLAQIQQHEKNKCWVSSVHVTHEKHPQQQQPQRIPSMPVDGVTNTLVGQPLLPDGACKSDMVMQLDTIHAAAVAVVSESPSSDVLLNEIVPMQDPATVATAFEEEEVVPPPLQPVVLTTSMNEDRHTTIDIHRRVTEEAEPEHQDESHS